MTNTQLENKLERAYWRAVSVYDDNSHLDSAELDAALTAGFEELMGEVSK